MNNRLLAPALVAAGALFGVTAGLAAGTLPLWNYHNGNTVLAHTTDYRNGYYIGVVDGYTRAHVRLADRAEGGVWLDRCLAGGWTVDKTAATMEAHLQKSVPRMSDPAADIVLDGLMHACGAAAK